jgi:predicted nucleotide-binding protein
MKLRLSNEAVVNVYDKGTFNVQGKAAAEMEALLGRSPAGASSLPAAAGSPKRNVFVVYGHDRACRDQLEATLRRWGLEPLILDQLPTEGQTVIEKLESALAQADFGVVLATPDDEGYRAGREDEKAFRARQNVVLEMGMLLARLGRKSVAILLKEQETWSGPLTFRASSTFPFETTSRRRPVLRWPKQWTLLATRSTSPSYEAPSNNKYLDSSVKQTIVRVSRSC